MLHYCHSAEEELGAVGFSLMALSTTPSPTDMMAGRQVGGILEPSVCGVPCAASGSSEGVSTHPGPTWLKKTVASGISPRFAGIWFLGCRCCDSTNGSGTHCGKAECRPR